MTNNWRLNMIIITRSVLFIIRIDLIGRTYMCAKRLFFVHDIREWKPRSGVVSMTTPRGKYNYIASFHSPTVCETVSRRFPSLGRRTLFRCNLFNTTRPTTFFVPPFSCALARVSATLLVKVLFPLDSDSSTTLLRLVAGFKSIIFVTRSLFTPSHTKGHRAERVTRPLCSWLFLS